MGEACCETETRYDKGSNSTVSDVRIAVSNVAQHGLEQERIAEAK